MTDTTPADIKVSPVHANARLNVVVNGPVIINQSGSVSVNSPSHPPVREHKEQIDTGHDTHSQVEHKPSEGHNLLDVLGHLHSHFEAEKAALEEQIRAMQHQANVVEHVDDPERQALASSIDTLKTQLAHVGNVSERLGRLHTTLSNLAAGKTVNLSHTDHAVLSTAPALLHETRAILNTKRSSLDKAKQTRSFTSRAYQEAGWIHATNEVFNEVFDNLDRGVNDVMRTLGVKSQGIAPGMNMMNFGQN